MCIRIFIRCGMVSIAKCVCLGRAPETTVSNYFFVLFFGPLIPRSDEVVNTAFCLAHSRHTFGFEQHSHPLGACTISSPHSEPSPPGLAAPWWVCSHLPSQSVFLWEGKKGLAH